MKNKKVEQKPHFFDKFECFCQNPGKTESLRFPLVSSVPSGLIPLIRKCWLNSSFVSTIGLGSS